MVGDFALTAADFRHLPTRCRFVVLMPQWDFLTFLSEKAKGLPTFDLRMQHEAVDLLRVGERITGVNVQIPGGAVQIKAHLVVGCDGRHSITRTAAQLDVLEFGVPIDVLWFRLSRTSNDPDQLLGNFNYGRVLVLINRGNYFQAGLLIRKGSFDDIQRAGMDAFRKTVLQIAPYLGNRVAELRNWDQIKLLSVQLNRLRQWHRPGLLCIGDAAHAMSPAGGVGINLAIQDAVATANLLGAALREGRATDDLLVRVQQRREFPTRVTQFLQANAHKLFERVFQSNGPIRAPWQLKMAVQIPGVQSLLGLVVGVGIRPEHIETRPPSSRPARRVLTAVAFVLGMATAATVLRLRRVRRSSTFRPAA